MSGAAPPGPTAVQVTTPPAPSTPRNTPWRKPVAFTKPAQIGWTPAVLMVSRRRCPDRAAAGRLLLTLVQVVFPPVTSRRYTPAPAPFGTAAKKRLALFGSAIRSVTP